MSEDSFVHYTPDKRQRLQTLQEKGCSLSTLQHSVPWPGFLFLDRDIFHLKSCLAWGLARGGGRGEQTNKGEREEKEGSGKKSSWKSSSGDRPRRRPRPWEICLPPVTQSPSQLDSQSVSRIETMCGSSQQQALQTAQPRGEPHWERRPAFMLQGASCQLRNVLPSVNVANQKQKSGYA